MNEAPSPYPPGLARSPKTPKMPTVNETATLYPPGLAPSPKTPPSLPQARRHKSRDSGSHSKRRCMFILFYFLIPHFSFLVSKSSSFSESDSMESLLDLSIFKRHVRPPIVHRKGKKHIVFVCVFICIFLDLDKRAMIACEVLTSEQTYVMNIEILVENFLKPLRVAANKKDSKFGFQQIEEIFGNVEQLLRINKDLCGDLEGIFLASFFHSHHISTFGRVGFKRSTWRYFCKMGSNVKAIL